MASSNIYDAVDVIVRARKLPVGGPPIATASRVLVDINGVEVLSADDAAAQLAALISGTDLTTSGVLTTLGTNIGEHDAQGVTLLAALLATTGAGGVILPKVNIVSASSPVSTGTVTASASKQNETLYLTPAGTIAALTFVFPSNGNSSLGQIIRLVSHQTVSALTVSAAGLTILGTAITDLAVDVPVAWQKVAASTWMLIS